MALAFVSAGSNIEPEKNIRAAVRLLSSEVRVTAISTVYRTEPIGPPGQPPFHNCVIKMKTLVHPRKLKQNILQRTERILGRERTNDKYAPRTIDLDLILYDGLILHDPDLILPDPDIAGRPFLIACLYELEPGLVIPGTGIALNEAAGNIRESPMTPLPEYTALLREELRTCR